MFCKKYYKNSFFVEQLWSCFCNFKKQPPEVFYEKTVLKNCAILTRKHLCWSVFLMSWQAYTFNNIKKRLKSRCFSVNIVKIFINTYFGEHLWSCFCNFLIQIIFSENNDSLMLRSTKLMLTHQGRTFISYINQSIDLRSKLISWFLYHESIGCYRGSRSQMLFKIGALRNFAIFLHNTRGSCFFR